jgi:hypothetical protein
MAFIYAMLIALSLAQTSTDRPPLDPLDEFYARVEAYAQLRRQVASVIVPRLEPMSDPRTLCDARDALAIGIARARPNARMGDLLFPAVAEIVRERIRRTAGPEALREWFHALYSEGQKPPRRRVTVHTRVPADEFPPVTPVGLLAILPELPPELAYRLAGRDLLLVDPDVSLVIDVLPEALPSPLRP